MRLRLAIGHDHRRQVVGVARRGLQEGSDELTLIHVAERASAIVEEIDELVQPSIYWSRDPSRKLNLRLLGKPAAEVDFDPLRSLVRCLVYLAQN